MKRFSGFLATLIVLMVTALLVTPAAGQTRLAWTQPMLLGPGWWQSLTVDQEGRLHVAWYGSVENGENLGSPDIMSYRVREPDGTWSELNDVLYTGDGGYTVRNAIATTSNGILHAAFRAHDIHRFASAPARAALNASLWNQPLTINDGGYYIDMIADRHDNLHMIYSGGIGVLARGGQLVQAELTSCALCNDMFYRRSVDGGQTWSTPVPIGFEAFSGSDRIDIFEGSSGRLYIVWDEGVDWYQGSGTAKDVRIVYSDDSGLTWSDPIILDGGGYLDRRPVQIAAAELRDGSLMAVWRYAHLSEPNIYYQLSTDTGATWTDPQPVPGIFTRSLNDTPLDDYELLVDRQGTVSLFAVGKTTPTPNNLNAALYQVQYRNGEWLSPKRIFYSREARPEWPKASLGVQNDIHLTFFTRGIEEGAINVTDAAQNLDVYYAYYPGNLPAVTAPFVPTQTPMPTPTVVQFFEPTPTPFNVQPLTGETVRPVSADTYAAEVLLSGMGAAGIGCVLLFIVLRLLGRR